MTVSKNGDLTAVGVGTAIITAKTSKGTAKTFTITVNEVVAESISISENEKEILIGDTTMLSCIFTPENTTYKEVEWKSDNERIVSVEAGGRITGKEIGQAVITATHKELSDSITVQVKPIVADKVEIVLPDDIEMKEETKPMMKKSSSVQLNALIEPDNTTYKEIEWSVSEEGLATIDGNGVLTAHASGIVIVTAITQCGKTDEIEIEIYYNAGLGTAGICGTAVVIGSGATVYFKKKKKRQNTNEI